MKLIGIVAEYNPFHNGHQYQIDTSKERIQADGVIIIMSGHFVQRGMPAFVDKWTRAEMALACGANLVLELPTYYATASAESFANGAISLLNATGLVTHLSFGSESEHLEALHKIAHVLADESEAFKESLKNALSTGLSFPSAREKALLERIPKAYHIHLNQANVILGIEYLKALIQTKSKIEPLLIKRIGKGYHDESTDSPLASATAIRKSYFDTLEKTPFTQWMPENAVKVFEKCPFHPVQMTDFEKELLFILRRSDASSLKRFREVTEGLENKLVKASEQAVDYETLIKALKSKRYTQTKIHRLLLNVLLGIEPLNIDIQRDGYLRVLGMDQKGKHILKKMKQSATLPIISNYNKIDSHLKENPLLALDERATNLYNLAQKNSAHRRGCSDSLKKTLTL